MLTWKNRRQAACDSMVARERVVAITNLLRFGLSQAHGGGGGGGATTYISVGYHILTIWWSKRRWKSVIVVPIPPPMELDQRSIFPLGGFHRDRLAANL